VKAADAVQLGPPSSACGAPIDQRLVGDDPENGGTSARGRGRRAGRRAPAAPRPNAARDRALPSDPELLAIELARRPGRARDVLELLARPFEAPLGLEIGFESVAQPIR